MTRTPPPHQPRIALLVLFLAIFVALPQFTGAATAALRRDDSSANENVRTLQRASPPNVTSDNAGRLPAPSLYSVSWAELRLANETEDGAVELDAEEGHLTLELGYNGGMRRGRSGEKGRSPGSGRGRGAERAPKGDLFTCAPTKCSPMALARVLVQVRALIDGRSTVVLKQTVEVCPGTKSIVRLPLWTIDLEPGGSAAIMRVLASFARRRMGRDARGGINRRSVRLGVPSRKTTSPLHLHKTRDGLSVLAYGYDAFLSKYNGGRPSGGGTPGALHLNLTTPPSGGGGGGNAYDVVEAPYQTDFLPGDVLLCVQYHYLFVDSGLGEDFYDSTEIADMWMRARGIYVKVTDPDSNVEVERYTDRDGCLRIALIKHDNLFGTWTVTAWTRAKIPLSYSEEDWQNNEGIVWSTYHGLAGTDGQMVEIEVELDESDAGHVRYIPLEVEFVTDAMAAATHSVWRLRQLLGSNMPPALFHISTAGFPHPLCNIGCALDTDPPALVSNPDCGQEETPSCDPNVASEKYGITHEVGHFFDSQLMNAHGGGYIDENDHVPEGVVGACSFYSDLDESDPEALQGPGAHALRSLELTGAAFKEGFAHFVSAAAWNALREEAGGSSEGVFVYYKSEMADEYIDQYYSDMDDDGWKVSLGLNTGGVLGGELNYRDNVCFDNNTVPWYGEVKHYFEDPPRGPGDTELDWLRFFWDLVNDPTDYGEVEAPTFAETATFLGEVTGLTQKGAREGLWDYAASTPDWAERVHALAEKHGVDPV